ncbi:MAG: glycosyltransferase family 4 protein [Nitrospira sp.]|nr:glycosyltransferase family 4 protein [Nitrospira sp.]
MRLLFINRYFYPDISATAQLLTELAEDLDERGDHITVITGNTAYLGGEARLPAREMHHGIRILRVGFTRFGRSHTLGRLADYLSFWLCAFWAAVRMKDQDCLVVLSDPPLLSVFAVIVRIFRPIKTVCWLQDVFPDIAIRAGVLREGLFARFLRGVARWSLSRMDQVVVIGRCMERYLLSQGLPAHRLINISNWADGRHLRPAPRADNEFLRQHGLADRFVVMYSGNHGVVHDVDTMIALIRETSSIPRLCFCFVGEGVWKRTLMDIAQAEGWQHVEFLPYQPKALLQSSLSAADIHLVTLQAGMEGLSIPSKAYGILAVGRPMIFIGPPGSETALIVREGEFGYGVPPGDTKGAVRALLAAYSDHSLLEKQGQAASRYFNTHCDRSIATEQFRQMLQHVAVPSSTQPAPLRSVSPPTGSP